MLPAHLCRLLRHRRRTRPLPDCAQANRKRGIRRILGGLALGAVALGRGGAGLFWLSRTPPTTPARRAQDARFMALRAQLDQEPCDRTRAVPYAQALFSAEDWRGCIQFSDDFVARCGKFPALRSISYAFRPEVLALLADLRSRGRCGSDKGGGLEPAGKPGKG